MSVEALRSALLRSLATSPDDFDGREPLWMELHRQLRAANVPPPADQSAALAQERT